MTKSSTNAGNYALVYELEDGKPNGNAAYVGHIQDDTDEQDVWYRSSGGEVIATMGGTGEWVEPKGTVHAHVELWVDQQAMGNPNRDPSKGPMEVVQTQGDISIWD